MDYKHSYDSKFHWNHKIFQLLLVKPIFNLPLDFLALETMLWRSLRFDEILEKSLDVEIYTYSLGILIATKSSIGNLDFDS